jgi:hypothetical protein
MTQASPQAEKAPLSPLSFTTQLATMADDLFGGAFGGPSTPPRHAFIPMDTHACDHPGGGIVFALYVPGATLPDVGISVNDHDHQLFVSVARSGSAPPNPGYSTRSEVFTGPQSRIVSVPKRFDVSRARVVGLCVCKESSHLALRVFARAFARGEPPPHHTRR